MKRSRILANDPNALSLFKSFQFQPASAGLPAGPLGQAFTPGILATMLSQAVSTAFSHKGFSPVAWLKPRFEKAVETAFGSLVAAIPGVNAWPNGPAGKALERACLNKKVWILTRTYFVLLLILLFTMNDWMAGAPADGFDVLLRAEVDKTQPFVGEQVILTYLILTQQPIYGVALEEQPDLNHFLTEAISLAERPQAQPVNVRGRVYQSFPIKRTALYPLVATELTIPPLTVAIDVATPQSDSAAVSTTIYRPSNPVTIVARPLPVAGRPRAFSGAVGNYQISMETYKDRIRAGEPAELTLRIRGRGNVSALSLPPLPPAEQLKVYPAKLINSRFGLIAGAGDGIKGIGYGGEKAWRLTIIPKTTGDITLNPVEISYFNPETGRYHTTHSDALTLHVDRSPPAGTLASQGMVAAPERTTVRTVAVWMLLLALVLLVAAFYYLGIFGRIISPQKRASPEGKKQRVDSYMAEAVAVLPNPNSKTFFDLVAEGLKGCLENKLQISLASLTVTEIKARITEKGIAAADAEEVARILETCDRARFATALLPMSLREKLYQDTVKLTKKL